MQREDPPNGVLLLDAELQTVSLFASLRAAGIPVLVLKGAIHQRWLYGDDPSRPSGDVDLLVRPDSLGDAEDVLMGLGFVNRFDGRAPEWVDQHGHSWVGTASAREVDLHRWVWGCTASPEVVWAALWESREPVELVTGAVDALGVAARCMHTATHVAQHGKAPGQPVDDLRRALAHEPYETWARAAAMADACGATSAFADGLDTLPEGNAVRVRLGLVAADPADRPPPPEVESLHPAGEGLLRLRRADGLTERLRIARREVFPSVRFMRLRSLQAPLARRGPLGLAAAYPARWAYIVRALWRPHRRGR